MPHNQTAVLARKTPVLSVFFFFLRKETGVFALKGARKSVCSNYAQQGRFMMGKADGWKVHVLIVSKQFLNKIGLTVPPIIPSGSRLRIAY